MTVAETVEQEVGVPTRAVVGDAREGPMRARMGRLRGLLRRVAGYGNAWAWGTFCVLLGLGAFLRFWRLGQQAFWTDEISTAWRISGSFDHLLLSLSDQGFPPGWYMLLRWWSMLVEWWTGSGGVAFAPETLRFPVAVMGTLTVPAIYWVARHFTDRRGALLVMLLAAVNPYLIYYARDIKMYGACWFLVTVNVAIFLQWQASHRHWLWWPLYALTAALAVLMHAMAWVVLIVQVVWLLSHRRAKALDVPLYVAALGLAALVPIYWYTHQTEWVERAAVTISDAGLPWVKRYTDMSWKTVASLPCVHVFGFLLPDWPVSDLTMRWFGLYGFEKYQATRTLPWLVTAQWWAAYGLFAVLGLGLLPWRGKRADGGRLGRWWWVALWVGVPMLLVGLGSLPKEHPLSLPPHEVCWEPRYLGIAVPGFLLWLGAALRRLPSWPLRSVAIAAVVGVCTASALVNHVLYRQPPWGVLARLVAAESAGRELGTVAWVRPYTRATNGGDRYAILIARGERPPEGKQVEGLNWEMGLHPEVWDDQHAWRGRLEYLRQQPGLRALVLTDRMGDVEEGAYGDAGVQAILGPEWKMVAKEMYAEHYEWRYYIVQPWRTRVWVRVGA